MFDITQFRTDILIPTLEGLQIRDVNLRELLVFTCAVESSGGTYVKQINGPALGIYQIQPNTFSELWHNYIIRQPDVVNLLSMNLHINRFPDPFDLITDLKLATATCVLYYKWKKVHVNSTEDEELWNVYKQYYNTELGKAEKEPSIKLYRKFIKV